MVNVVGSECLEDIDVGWVIVLVFFSLCNIVFIVCGVMFVCWVNLVLDSFGDCESIFR